MTSIFVNPSSPTWKFLAWAWSCDFGIDETVNYDRSHVDDSFVVTPRMVHTAFDAMDIDYECHMLETKFLSFPEFAALQRS